jgi:glycosyltransferase involved in cell wall biosynthesis
MKMSDMLQKGNVWYIRHYEEYFDRVYVVYLAGNYDRIVRQGKTVLISLGTKNTFKDILFSPFKLYRLSKKIKADKYLTHDLIFSWWHFCCLKIISGYKLYLSPVCIPSEIYKSSGRSLTGILPYNLERILIYFSIKFAGYILISQNTTFYIKFLKLNEKDIKPKVVIADLVVDELPTIGFYNSLFKNRRLKLKENDYILVYVGRLHREKLIYDVIKIFDLVQKHIKNVKLNLIGDGPEYFDLVKLVNNLKIEDKVTFLGYKKSEEISKYLFKSHIFISTLTGTALREAFFCRIPVVAYNIDWIKKTFNGDELIKIKKGDINNYALEVIRLLEDNKLQEEVVEKAYKKAQSMWGRKIIYKALKQTFER